MKLSDELFDLIKSLKKTEKRYFKIYATRHSNEANSVKLFTALDKMEEYDEEELRQIFRGEKFLEQLPVAKHYLSKIILESMTLYHSEASANLEISHLLQQIEFLMSRGLIDQAARKIAKAESIAIRSENYQKLLDCYTWERVILMKSNYKAIPELFDKEQDALNKLMNILDYRQLSAQVYNVLKQAGRIPSQEQWEAIYSALKHPLLTDSNNALTFEAKAHYFNIHAGVSFIKGDNEQIYKYTKAHVEFLDQHPAQMQLRPKSYLDSLHNYLHSCLDMRYFDELEIGLRKLRTLPMDSPYMQETAFITLQSLELLLRLTSGEFAKGLEAIPDIETGLEKFPDLPVTEKTILYNRVICLLLANDKPAVALKWVNTILNDTSVRSIRKDILTSIKVLNIIVHFELENYEYAQYLVKSDSRSFRKDSMGLLEYMILRMIAKLPTKNKKITAPNHSEFQRILKEYLDCFPNETLPNQGNNNSLSFLYQWVDSKANQLPMQHVTNDEG